MADPFASRANDAALVKGTPSLELGDKDQRSQYSEAFRMLLRLAETPRNASKRLPKWPRSPDTSASPARGVSEARPEARRTPALQPHLHAALLRVLVRLQLRLRPHLGGRPAAQLQRHAVHEGLAVQRRVRRVADDGGDLCGSWRPGSRRRKGAPEVVTQVTWKVRGPTLDLGQVGR